MIAIGLALLILPGNRRARFATWWMLLALAPFLFFNWGNTSRYLYQPAIGFSMLLAEGVVYLDRVLRPRVPSLARSAILTALVAGITVRFALFAMANVASFAERTQTYRNYTAHFREIHGDVPSDTTVAPDARLDEAAHYQFATPPSSGNTQTRPFKLRRTNISRSGVTRRTTEAQRHRTKKMNSRYPGAAWP